MKKSLRAFLLIVPLLSAPGLKAAPGDGPSLNVGTNNSVPANSASGVFGDANWPSLSRSITVGTRNGFATGFSGSNSIVVGSDNFYDTGGYYVSDSSVIIGTNNTGLYEIIDGDPYYSSDPLRSSLVVGDFNLASVDAGLVVGINNFANARGFVIGDGLIAEAWGRPMIVLGQYNEFEPSNGKSILFSVGNGYVPPSGSPVRRNALEIYADGEAAFRAPLKLYHGAAPAPSIVLDPVTPQITVGGQSLMTATSTTAQVFTAPSYAFNSGSTNRLTIDANGLATVGGVRPGSDPTSQLHVKGPLAVWPPGPGGEIPGSWPNSRASAVFAKYPDNYLLLAVPTKTTSGLAVSYNGAESDNSEKCKTILGAQLGPIEFRTGVSLGGDWRTSGSLRMKIGSTGNVGIGTASPQATLDVNGTAKISGAVTMAGAVTMPRQGDVGMGRFGNGGADL